MTARRDDMVFRVRRQPEGSTRGAHAREVAREERRLAGGKRKSQTRMARKAAAQRIRKKRSMARKAMRKSAIARMGATGVARGVATRAATSNPYGLLIAGLVVAVAVMARELSGRSFENMGAQINRMLLGDLDEKARAKMQARKRIIGNRDLTRIAGIEGSVNSQILSVYNDVYDMELRQQSGIAKFMEDKAFQSNTLIDQMVIYARKRMKDFFIDLGLRGPLFEVWGEILRQISNPPGIELIKRLVSIIR